MTLADPAFPLWFNMAIVVVERLGIPAAIAIFVLVRLNGSVLGLKHSNVELSKAMMALAGLIDRQRDADSATAAEIRGALGRIEQAVEAVGRRL